MKRIDFNQKKVLITGAASGIGRALSVEFARRGAYLAMDSLPGEQDTLVAHARQLEEQFNIKAWVFPIDLLAANAPQELYQQVKSKVGDIFALVNNAGTAAYGNFCDIEAEHHIKTLLLNFSVPLQLMHLFLPDMVKQGEGVIFNTSSVSALQPTPFQSAYGATKAGLQSLSEAVNAELKGTGVAVCTLNPPFTETPLLRTDGHPKDLWFYMLSGIKSPAWVAQKALKAFEKRKKLYIPGAWNAFIHLVMVKFAPRSWVNAFSRFSLQRRGADNV